VDTQVGIEIGALDDDIVVASRLEGTVVSEEDIRASIRAIRERFPLRRLLLVVHKHTYSLDIGAATLIEGVDEFDAIASLVPDPELREMVDSVKRFIDFQMPYEVFAEADAAVEFLRRHARFPRHSTE
jgi:hypothetical protein